MPEQTNTRTPTQAQEQTPEERHAEFKVRMYKRNILVTGGARRIGKAITRHLHFWGRYRVLIHCNNSVDEANELAAKLNERHADTAEVVRADLSDSDALQDFIKRINTLLSERDEQLHAVINNASAFFPTPADAYDAEKWLADWDTFANTNAKAPFFLAMGLREKLKATSLDNTRMKSRSAVINIIDIHSERPLKDYGLYSISKATLAMVTRVLARELAPEIRCNGISPGAILWPEVEDYEARHREIIERTALKREGHPDDIVSAVTFLLRNDYVTGQIINVDGGRTLSN